MVVEKKNPTVSKQNKPKLGPAVINLVVETLQRGSRKKAMVLEETTMRRSPRMKGKTSKVLVET